MKIKTITLIMAILAIGFPGLSHATLINVALGKPVTALGWWYGLTLPGNAVDGNRDSRWVDDSFWGELTVDLGAVYQVERIDVWGIREHCCPNWNWDGYGNNYRLLWSDGMGHSGSVDGYWLQFFKPMESWILGNVPIRYLTYRANVGSQGISDPAWKGYHWVNLNEIEVYARTTVQGVPLPATVWLFAAGMMGLAATARQRL